MNEVESAIRALQIANRELRILRERIEGEGVRATPQQWDALQGSMRRTLTGIRLTRSLIRKGRRIGVEAETERLLALIRAGREPE